MNELRLALREEIIWVLNEIASVDTSIVLLVILLVIAAIVIDSLVAFAGRAHKDTGLDLKHTTVSVDGSPDYKVKNYVSELQGLAGRPDALILEEGYIIPIERKPLAKKIRDRYVAQLLVYMRLVEEFEGKKPPYGYLILGPSCRRVKIYNSPKRQKWLQGMIDEMQAILKEQTPARPDPHPRKCAKCSVQNICSSAIFPRERQTQQVAVGDRLSAGLASSK